MTNSQGQFVEVAESRWPPQALLVVENFVDQLVVQEDDYWLDYEENME